METRNANTPNGGSNNKLTPEEVQELLTKTEPCRVIVTGQKDIAPDGFEVSNKDVVSATVTRAPKIRDGILPENQGDTISPITAAEINADRVVVVLDKNKGRAQTAEPVEENETQMASRKKEELAQSAERKYQQNNQAR